MGGQVGLPKVPTLEPPRPDPPGAVSSRLSHSNSLSTFHRISPNEILPLKREQARVDFLGKRPLQNLIYNFFVSICFISAPHNMGKHAW